MREAQKQEALRKGMRTLWIIWAAMMYSLLTYVIICHLVEHTIRKPAVEEVPIGTLKIALYAISVAELAVSYYLRKYMVKTQSPHARWKHIQLVADRVATPAVALYTTAVIVSLAISESIAIYGLILFLHGDSFRTLYTFVVTSAIAIYFYRPKRKELEQVVKSYAEAEGSGPDIKGMT